MGGKIFKHEFNTLYFHFILNHFKEEKKIVLSK